ncbi:methyltransferase domain-containing protein [Jatrophihabitans fulvus]
MRGNVSATRRGFRVRTGDRPVGTVDVFFDGHRIWSVKLPDEVGRGGSRYVRWHRAITPHLHGATTLSVRDSATGDELGSAEVRFDPARSRGKRVEMVDAQGRRLTMDKWNRLGPTFEGNESGVQQRLLAGSVELAERMQQWGYPIYIVGGTLLGALRSGGLLPHDDDVDFAYWCDKSNPEDVTLVSFEVERRLTDAGYTVVRHSHAHLELVFFAADGRIDHYIDIFTGYHSPDGLYNQPFALRGDLPLEKLLPQSTIEVDGVTLPAPAEPSAWCEFAYGPDWLVPDPSFQWKTPRSTLRRFENSFGVFNRQRVFWEKRWQQVEERRPSRPGEFEDADRMLRLLPPNSFVVDLGCGDGRQAEHLAAAGHRVLGVDYSLEALRVARRTQPENVEYRFLNLNDRHSLVTFGLELIASGQRPYFFARELLQEMPQLGRSDLFTMLRGVLDHSSCLLASWDANPVGRIAANPETWHVSVPGLRREAWRWKLGMTVLADRERDTPHGTRNTVSAVIWV